MEFDSICSKINFSSTQFLIRKKDERQLEMFVLNQL